MRMCSDVIGKPIITVDNGTNLGIATDLYFDQTLESVAGIFLGSQGMLRKKNGFVDARDIVLLGNDAILVCRSDARQGTESNAASRSWVRRKRVLGRPLTTSGGTFIGSVGGIYLDPNCEVRAFALARVQIAGPIATVGFIMRDAVLDAGDDDIPMRINLAKAEQQSSELLLKTVDRNPHKIR